VIEDYFDNIDLEYTPFVSLKRTLTLSFADSEGDCQTAVPSSFAAQRSIAVFPRPTTVLIALSMTG
jgi:hypothetical protein